VATQCARLHRQSLDLVTIPSPSPLFVCSSHVVGSLHSRQALDRAKRANAVHAGAVAARGATADALSERHASERPASLSASSAASFKSTAEDLEDALTRTPLDRRPSIEEGAGVPLSTYV
jgi:hypothetical protein